MHRGALASVFAISLLFQDALAFRPRIFRRKATAAKAVGKAAATKAAPGAPPAAAARKALRRFVFGYRPKPVPPKPVSRADYSVRAATALLRLGFAGVRRVPVSRLFSLRDAARLLYVLERESPGQAGRVHGFLRRLDPRYPDIQRKLALYHQLYDLPCQSAVARVGDTKVWPPEYRCPDRVVAPSPEPTPLLTLSSPMQVVAPPGDPDTQDPDRPEGNAAVAERRRAVLRERDRFRVPGEDRPPPREFCAGSRCFGTYREIAAAIYGARAKASSPPVFCAPRREGAAWSLSTVHCSSNWFDTLGQWRPWKANGEPADAPEAGVLPPYACFGSPHILDRHMVLPPGGQAGSGFYCRNRIFRVLATKAAKSQADLDANLTAVCQEMRGQVWGEKYPSINDEYRAWCEKKYGRGSSRCPKAWPKGGAGSSPTPPLPFMLLSREELLFFFGHQELFCRADRPGLTHFLFNDTWAKTFTCGIARGLLEAGPFEEGVQACALSPFVAEEPPGGLGPDAGALKARLHCWQHNRPTCEEVSRDPRPEEIYKRSVFDEYDALREYRRTRNARALSFFDLKNAEKMQSYEDFLSYADVAKDEGTFGVKEFCRFVDATRKRIRCGYTKQTMAQWYELRKDEVPEGCEQGVCARGAFRRGYYCGLFASTDLFCPDKNLKHCKPFWVCGIDVGRAGRKMLGREKAVCIGGARALAFHSPRGDRSSLQCYERRFRWGESAKSEEILRRFDWGKIVEDAVKQAPSFYDSWLHGLAQIQSMIVAMGNAQLGSPESHRMFRLLRVSKHMRSSAEKTFAMHTQQDDTALVAWAREWGHTLGHRSSLGQLLMGEHGVRIPAVLAFRRMALRRDWVLKGPFQTRGLACRGPDCEPLKFTPSDDSDVPRDENRAKDIAELLGDVAFRGRPADEKWYADFRRIVTEGDQLRIATDMLEVARRVHRLHWILNAARLVLLRQAKEYADAVISAAGKAKLTRMELLERASSDSIEARFKGAVFCVNVQEVSRFRRHVIDDSYVCASSPLLVAGMLERSVRGVAREEERDRARNGVKFGWCYGGIEGERLYDPSHRLQGTPVLVPVRHIGERFQGNPYNLSVPQGSGPQGWEVLEHRRRGSRPRSHLESPRVPRALQVLGRPSPMSSALDTTLVSQVWKNPNFRPAAGLRPRPGKPGAAAAATVARPRPGAGRPLAVVEASFFSDPNSGWFNREHWMSCAGFQYNDAAWQVALPEKPPAPPAPQASAATSGGSAALSTDPRAAKANDILADAQKQAGPMVSFVMKYLGHAPDLVKNLAHPSGPFLDEWKEKLTDIGRKLWERASQEIEGLKKQVAAATALADKAREALDAARETMHRAELEAAKAQGQAKEKAEAKVKEAKDAYEAARGELRTRTGERDAKIREVASGVRAICKANEKVDGSGNLLAGMLEALNKLVMDRIMRVLEPNVRHLISYGMRFVRGLLSPIATAVISALASIPFVGGALAPIGQIAYELALNALEEAGHRALLGLVERLLAQLLRGALTPVFKVVQQKVLSGAFQDFTKVLGAACGGVVGGLKFAALPPRDRWLDRALACSARPIPLEWIHREAAVARAQMLRQAARMRTRVAAYARSLADRYLARYGLTYDSWMAAVGRDAQPVLVARAEEISRDLSKLATKMRARLRRAKDL